MPQRSVLIKNIKNKIRCIAEQYLKDNVNSVGIGYKVRNGVKTDELCIQFTVDMKMTSQTIMSAGESELPTTIKIDDEIVPTDVIQRTYTHVMQSPSITVNENRRTYSEPIVPGVSISNNHSHVLYGTFGCIVYSKEDEKPCILSNWHVLSGPGSRPEDDIVMPGIGDDHNNDRNVIGKLKKSYLGIEGDCAIASIEDRIAFDPVIMGLNVKVNQIGEPDIGDIVVKSGRTTGVTYGVVNRIHVISNVNYSSLGMGKKQVECFDIGPDKSRPAANNEISMEGDSGSVWLSVKHGQPTDVMFGLNFAGEAASETTEYALACYPTLFFEKLDIRI